jgi:hypothetical protein
MKIGMERKLSRWHFGVRIGEHPLPRGFSDSDQNTYLLDNWLNVWVVMIHNSVMAFFYNILCMMSFCPRFSFYRNICVPKIFYIYFVTEKKLFKKWNMCRFFKIKILKYVVLGFFLSKTKKILLFFDVHGSLWILQGSTRTWMGEKISL